MTARDTLAAAGFVEAPAGSGFYELEFPDGAKLTAFAPRRSDMVDISSGAWKVTVTRGPAELFSAVMQMCIEYELQREVVA